MRKIADFMAHYIIYIAGATDFHAISYRLAAITAYKLHDSFDLKGFCCADSFDFHKAAALHSFEVEELVVAGTHQIPAHFRDRFAGESRAKDNSPEIGCRKHFATMLQRALRGWSSGDISLTVSVCATGHDES